MRTEFPPQNVKGLGCPFQKGRKYVFLPGNNNFVIEIEALHQGQIAQSP